MKKIQMKNQMKKNKKFKIKTMMVFNFINIIYFINFKLKCIFYIEDSFEKMEKFLE